MSETRSIKFRHEQAADENNTAELPTLKLSDIVAEPAVADGEQASMDKAAAWISELEGEIDNLKLRWQEVDDALHRSEQRATELERELEEKDRSTRDHEASLQTARNEQEQLAAEMARLQQRDHERDETIRELNRSLQSQTSLSEMLRSDLAKRDTELESTRAKLAAIEERNQAKNRNLELRERKIGQLESRIAEQDRHIAELRDTKVELHEEIQKLRADLKLKQSMIDAFDRSARRLTDLNRSMKRRADDADSDQSLVIEAAHLFELAAGGEPAESEAIQTSFPAMTDGVHYMMVQGSGDDRKFHPLTQGEMTIGRARDCDICIVDETISRVHARLTMSERGVEIVDAGSTNGILVNKQEVKSARLKHGDTVSLAGTLNLTYVEVQPPTESSE